MKPFNIYVKETPPSEVSSFLLDDISKACKPRNIRITIKLFFIFKCQRSYTHTHAYILKFLVNSDPLSKLKITKIWSK